MNVELDPARALAIIEGLVMEATDGTETDAKSKMLSLVYRIAHGAHNGSCHNVHDDWRTEALELEKELVKRTVIPEWGTIPKRIDLSEP